MAETSGHHEEMKDFVGAEIFVAAVEGRAFQGVDASADGVEHAASEKESQYCRRDRGNVTDLENDQPAHVDESLIDEKEKFHFNECRPIVYSHGEYLGIGKSVGKFGFSVKKSQKTSRTRQK